MVGLLEVLPRHAAVGLPQLVQHLVVGLGRRRRRVAAEDLVGREDVVDQHRVVRDERAPRLGHQVGVRHAGGVARLGHLADDVGRVFLQRVVDRRVEVGLAAVVVHAEAAAAIEVAHVRAEPVQLDEDAARLAQRVLHGADVGDLRPDVEVQQLQAVEHLRLAQPVHRRHDLGGRQAELRAVARRLHPLAGALGRQPGADADHGAQVQVGRRGQDRLQLAHPVDRDHDAAPELLREQRGLDERAVLVAVAQDQRLGVLLQRQRDQQLRLRPGLDPEVERAAVLHQLLDDVALLVHLDRVDAAERAPVLVLDDRLLERAEQLLEARAQDVGEADEDREIEAAAAEVVHQFLEVDLHRPGPGGRHRDVAGLVDREEVARPSRRRCRARWSPRPSRP